MPKENRENMERNVFTAFKSLKSLTDFGIATYAFFVFAYVNGCGLFNKQATAMPIDMLGIKAHQHYYSLMYGLLFLAFMLLLYSRVELLINTLRRYSGCFEPKSDSRMITLYPWLASPFHELPRGRFVFYGALLVTLFNCAWLAVAHLLGIGAPSNTVIDPWVYRFVIGIVCTLATIAGSVCFGLIVQRVRSIRGMLIYE